jgi:hypothetical protein
MARVANSPLHADAHHPTQPHSVALWRRRGHLGVGIISGFPLLRRLLAADHRARICAPRTWRRRREDVLPRQLGAVDGRFVGRLERLCVDVDVVLWPGQGVKRVAIALGNEL